MNNRYHSNLYRKYIYYIRIGHERNIIYHCDKGSLNYCIDNIPPRIPVSQNANEFNIYKQQINLTCLIIKNYVNLRSRIRITITFIADTSTPIRAENRGFIVWSAVISFHLVFVVGTTAVVARIS